VTLRSSARELYLAVRGPVLKRMLRPGLRPAPDIDVDSLLIVSQERLGDIVLELSVLGPLCAANPELRLGVIAPRRYHELFHWCCGMDLLFGTAYNRAEEKALIADVTSHTWDVCLDLSTDYPLRPARIASRVGAGFTLGFVNCGREHYFRGHSNRCVKRKKAVYAFGEL
jgi:ADP-heptose:LPS heptosyltransferase